MPGFERSRFIDLNESLAKHLKCSICLEIFSNPIITKCDHTFCESCLQESIDSNTSSSNECPECRQTFSAKRQNDSNFVIISNFVFKSNRTANDIINELKIKCKYDYNGCQQSVKLDLLSAHHKECEHRLCKSCQFELKSGHNCVQLLKKDRDEWQQKSRLLFETNEQMKEKELKIKSVFDSFPSFDYTTDSTKHMNDSSDESERKRLENYKNLIENQKKEIRQNIASLFLLSQQIYPLDGLYLGSYMTHIKRLIFEQDHIKLVSIKTNTDPMTTIDINLPYNEIRKMFYSRSSSFESTSDVHIKTNRLFCHRIQELLNLGLNSGEVYDIDSKDKMDSLITFYFDFNSIQFDYCLRYLSLIEPRIECQEWRLK